MVSLINFKMVNEEPQMSGRDVERVETHEHGLPPRVNLESSSLTMRTKSKQFAAGEERAEGEINGQEVEQSSVLTMTEHKNKNRCNSARNDIATPTRSQQHKVVKQQDQRKSCHSTLRTSATSDKQLNALGNQLEIEGGKFDDSSPPPPPPPSSLVALKTTLVDNKLSASFVVTWRNLKFCIEPKWHEKLASTSAFVALASRMNLAPAPSSAAICAATSVSGGAKDENQAVYTIEDDNTTDAPSSHVRNSSHNRLNRQHIHHHRLKHQDNEVHHHHHHQHKAAATSSTTTAPLTRVVLDRLDGSFKSGELTAILGPSGAGKTTLLDCLTGHRKKSLSGSIKISSLLNTPAKDNRDTLNSRSAPCTCDSNAAHRCFLAPNNGTSKNLSHVDSLPILNANLLHVSSTCRESTQINGDNLKVSIIPQNDHLIGHLTVFETLNYASKMKNCYEQNFDHKLNVKRVAQQLGLMSSLNTRINKLSGGQYKRVSIAQELLSSPDILILDEPTSGLDAMTCYQTVQVLKRLTDDRQRQTIESGGQVKPIAVILTIHQPNSDVFQQFNHVYVVAQGGKCIYEGPPASIESVINRVGISLPNSYYNPATMIVEIAAGKFGQGAICKLNSIQKRQYDVTSANDEQNSTGDSAVDFPSSSSNDSDSDIQDQHAGDDDDDDSCTHCQASNQVKDVNGLNDDNNNCKSKIHSPLDSFGGGLINKGFTMEDDNNNLPIAVIVHQEDHLDDDSVKSTTSPKHDKRKRKRRLKKRSTGEVMNDDFHKEYKCTRIGKGFGDGGNPFGGGGAGGSGRGEKRIKLNSLKAEQKFPFWRHTYLHFHRSWVSILRDPMLCSMQLALHIIVPVMVSLVYGTYVGQPNACPRAGPIDIMAYALEPIDSTLQLQEDLRTTLENIGYIFFKLYGIIFAAMTVTVLTFPLDMHVLVKEFRNGWYGLSSYFLGRTLADIPFQLTLPLLAMSLSYYATGQPYSYMQWRFFSITTILILSSLIAQSQGLLFGAILMDKMKAAVFVAPAATTPIILFAGFLVRTQSIPRYLRPLSNLSYLRYAIEACLISRYGFNQCECDPAIFNQTVPELPPIARSMLDYWLSSFKPSPLTSTPDSQTLLANATSDILHNNSSLIETTTASAMSDTSHPDLFTKLIDSLARANSFGRNITSCEQVVPYPMIDYDLKDSQLFNCFAILLAMLIFTRLLTFFIVCFKVKRKV